MSNDALVQLLAAGRVEDRLMELACSNEYLRDKFIYPGLHKNMFFLVRCQFSIACIFNACFPQRLMQHLHKEDMEYLHIDLRRGNVPGPIATESVLASDDLHERFEPQCVTLVPQLRPLWTSQGDRAALARHALTLGEKDVLRADAACAIERIEARLNGFYDLVGHRAPECDEPVQ